MSAQEHEVMPEGAEPPPPGHRIMAIVRWILVVAMASVATAAMLRAFGHDHASASPAAEVWSCPMHPSVVQDHPGECPICGMALVKRDRADAGAKPVSHAGHRHEPSDPFACPMHPEETGKSAEDRCPLCFMRLEPKSTIDAGPPTTVPGLAPIELSLDRVQLIGMKTAKVARESLVPELRTIGYVAAPEGGLAKVTTKYGGWIERLVVAETGKKVRRGELLAVVYSPQVYLAAQEYATAKGFGAGAMPGVDLAADAKRRLDLLGVPPGEIAAIEKSGAARKTIGVVAPASGWIVQKNAVVGGSFQAGNELFVIADLTKVWVLVDVYEAELARVHEGQAAKLQVAAFPERTFEGVVKLVYPSVDPATRTAKVRLELANADMALRPGMVGNASIALPKAEGVVIPRDALVDTGELQYVFVQAGSGRFEPRRVTVGVRAGEKVEIRSGVAEGETVVTTGNFLLDSESRLQAALQGGS